MARASKIYSIFKAGNIEPLACFTVKWEAFAYIQKNVVIDAPVQIISTPDGKAYEPMVIWDSETVEDD